MDGVQSTCLAEWIFLFVCLSILRKFQLIFIFLTWLNNAKAVKERVSGQIGKSSHTQMWIVIASFSHAPEVSFTAADWLVSFIIASILGSNYGVQYNNISILLPHYDLLTKRTFATSKIGDSWNSSVVLVWFSISESTDKHKRSKVMNDSDLCPSKDFIRL